MLERLLVSVMRPGSFLLSLGVVALMAPSAGAALKKYDIVRQLLLNYSNTSPRAEFNTTDNTGSIGLIDDSGANPALSKIVLIFDHNGMTTLVPALTNGFVFFSQTSSEGFNPTTGTGSTNGSINWGNMQGWTISGTTYCHSVPSYVCDLVGATDSTTTDPAFLSSNYDMGTWTFHGTGWTQNLGWITRTSITTAPGNVQYFMRGVRVLDGTVPALPLLGIAAVSVSVFAMGVAATRRRR